MNKMKEGVSVKEIEDFAKRHRFEVFFCLMFLLACVFGLIGFFKAGWNLLTAVVGAGLGVLLPMKVDGFLKKSFQFIFGQENMVQMVLGIVGLILSIFLPPLTFLLIGLSGGVALYRYAMDASQRK